MLKKECYKYNQNMINKMVNYKDLEKIMLDIQIEILKD